MLHTCVALHDSQSLQDLSVNSSVTAKVNYQRRRQTAPNHTMTHVLNFALREVRACASCLVDVFARVCGFLSPNRTVLEKLMIFFLI